MIYFGSIPSRDTVDIKMRQGFTEHDTTLGT